jgi:uncharacterized protein (TIGR03083 family)
MTLDYLAHIRENSARFGDVLRDAPADGQVPTCPDWSSDDLIWHLAEVQWFWGTVVRTAVEEPDGIEHPDRPADRQGLLAFFDEATGLLQTSLAETDPSERRWTWSDDQSAGFIRRRQAHEALIHRVDAELTADVERAPMDPALCSDGVDEALRVMFGGAPGWAKVVLDPAATLQVRATDTGQDWLVTLGTFSGTSPDSGKAYDASPLVEVSDHGDVQAAATVEGTAADLDCWLWGRPAVGELTREGDEAVHARFQQVVSEGID